MANYWVVGANWGGNDPQDQRFVEQGIWELGFKEGYQFERAKKMQKDDRIAIKRNGGGGQGKGKIQILHLGIIKGVFVDRQKIRCTMDWVATDLGRFTLAGRNVFRTVHGPYDRDSSKDGLWVREIFSL